MRELEPGDPRRIGEYRLLGRLGSGDMGHVYLARSDQGRAVAVKVVRPPLAEQQEFRARLRREVAAARRVGGVWTAPVLDADIEAELPWLATGYVAGPSLADVVSRYGALPERSVWVLAGGLVRALRDIHAAGIVHGDLKPSNVLITIDGPRVIDFGIARTGSPGGSPAFMAPELVRGDAVTPACDVFCLGAVLAYAASGRLPFGDAERGVRALMFRIAREAADLTGVPEGVGPVVRACLRKAPSARPSVDALLERFSRYGGAEPWLPGGLVAQLGRHAVGVLGAPGAGAGTRPPAGSGFPPAPPVRVSSSGAGGPGGVGSPSAGAGSGAGTRPPAGSGFSPAPPVRVSSSGAGGPGGVGSPSAGAGDGPSAESGSGAAPAGCGEHAAVGDGGLWPVVSAEGGPYGHPQSYARVSPEGDVRDRRSTWLLVLVALVVVLGAGGTVHTLMRGGGVSDTATVVPSSSDGAGDVPEGYLGDWEARTDRADGTGTRRLTLTQGRVGERVLALVADGVDYHCAFAADLARKPGADGTLELTAATVTSGAPLSSCAPGAPTVLTLLPDGRLERAESTGTESLTYTRRPG
ncbi:serine/threonine-protein kinase [Streptomyces sp. NBC_01601]|uniref:serine/threonine-protein kinase n=1 Tax=Streptomyces sp. NBC_01601 TaxID=2975892 RepID=UPI002E293001|nr:serine/threonine-protein kinase [Streptomyces sp. NBC_01601]